MPLIVSLLLRTGLLLAGLVFAASLLVLFAVLAAVWSLRALWARLTGRAVHPFAVRFGPRQGFADVMRRAPAASRTPRADAAKGRGRFTDVTDVEPRRP